MDGMPRRRRRLWPRRLVGVTSWLVILSMLVLGVPGPWGPAHLGVTLVSGSSMLPTYHSEDLLLRWHTGSYPAGTPVVYTVPAGEPGAGLDVVHRVVSVSPDGTHVTQGDNNPSIDPWRPRAADIRGKVVLRVPDGARWLRIAVSPVLLAVLCGLMVGAAVLSGRRDDDDPDDDNDDPGTPGLSRRRPRRPRERTPGSAAVVLLGVVALAATLVPASAASLGTLRSGNLYATTIAASVPPQGPVTTAVVTVTSVTQAEYCASVRVSTTSTTDVLWRVALNRNTTGITNSIYWLAEEPTTSNAVSGPFDRATGTWMVSGIGWNQPRIRAGVPATFTYCTPVGNAAPAVDVDVSVVVRGAAANAPGATYCADVRVSTTSSTYVKWSATINHATPGLTNPIYWLNAQPSPINAVPVSFVPATGTWVVQGASYNRLVVAGSPVTWSYCNAPTNPLAPFVDADVAVTPTTSSGPGGQYCADVTVSTVSTDWVRWRAVLTEATPNLTGPNYLLTSTPNHFNSTTIDFTAGSGTFRWRLGGESYNAYIRAGSPLTFRFCRPQGVLG